jgi:hypothetical protein
MLPPKRKVVLMTLLPAVLLRQSPEAPCAHHGVSLVSLQAALCRRHRRHHHHQR